MILESTKKNKGLTEECIKTVNNLFFLLYITDPNLINEKCLNRSAIQTFCFFVLL